MVVETLSVVYRSYDVCSIALSIAWHTCRFPKSKEWPPRSPDLSPPDFFLWGYLKGNVYKNNPHTVEELKNNITTASTSINIQVLHKVAPNMVKRARICITEQGAHFEHML
jgi:hypothetical protein